MTINEDLTNVFEEGKRAKLENLSLKDNPYLENSIKQRKWYEGWCQANVIEWFNKFPCFR